MADVRMVRDDHPLQTQTVAFLILDLMPKYQGGGEIRNR